MPHYIVQEWEQEKEGSRYPFVDQATLISDSGFSIPENTFVDAHLYPISLVREIFLTNILVENRKVTIYIGDVSKPKNLSANFDPLDAPDVLKFIDSNSRAGGVLVSSTNKLSVFQAWTLGLHSFQPRATTFVPSVLSSVNKEGFQGFVLETGEVFTGDIWLVGEDGIVITVNDDNSIQFNAVGDPLFIRRVCEEPGLFTTPSFVKTINGIAPDSNGNFNITAGNNLASDTILRIYPEEDEIIIEAAAQNLKE